MAPIITPEPPVAPLPAEPERQQGMVRNPISAFSTDIGINSRSTASGQSGEGGEVHRVRRVFAGQIGLPSTRPRDRHHRDDPLRARRRLERSAADAGGPATWPRLPPRPGTRRNRRPGTAGGSGHLDLPTAGMAKTKATPSQQASIVHLRPASFGCTFDVGLPRILEVSPSRPRLSLRLVWPSVRTGGLREVGAPLPGRVHFRWGGGGGGADETEGGHLRENQGTLVTMYPSTSPTLRKPAVTASSMMSAASQLTQVPPGPGPTPRRSPRSCTPAPVYQRAEVLGDHRDTVSMVSTKIESAPCPGRPLVEMEITATRPRHRERVSPAVITRGLRATSAELFPRVEECRPVRSESQSSDCSPRSLTVHRGILRVPRRWR